jgi:hypothetical protein
MNNRLKAEVAGGVAVLILLGLFLYQSYQKAVDTRTAEIIAAHDREADQKLTDRLNKLEQSDKDRQKDYESKTSAIRTQTPQQIVVKLPEYVPQATAPVQILPQNSPLVQSGAAQAGDAIVPASDIKPIAQALLDGQKCSADLVSCAQARQVWSDKYDAKSDEAKRWETAAKGGSVWKRVGKTILYVGGGIGIGYAIHH